MVGSFSGKCPACGGGSFRAVAQANDLPMYDQDDNRMDDEWTRLVRFDCSECRSVAYEVRHSRSERITVDNRIDFSR